MIAVVIFQSGSKWWTQRPTVTRRAKQPSNNHGAIKLGLNVFLGSSARPLLRIWQLFRWTTSRFRLNFSSLIILLKCTIICFHSRSPLCCQVHVSFVLRRRLPARSLSLTSRLLLRIGCSPLQQRCLTDSQKLHSVQVKRFGKAQSCSREREARFYVSLLFVCCFLNIVFHIRFSYTETENVKP